eukprot:1779085-Rhodomonas_salina.1
MAFSARQGHGPPCQCHYPGRNSYAYPGTASQCDTDSVSVTVTVNAVLQGSDAVSASTLLCLTELRPLACN